VNERIICLLLSVKKISFINLASEDDEDSGEDQVLLSFYTDLGFITSKSILRKRSHAETRL
jgi:hypothetical protein